MKKIFSFLLILVLFLLSGCSNNYVEIDGEKITVELARTDKEKQDGLMFREELCDKCGMLFIFEQESRYGFWMKNTLIPLDMVFINSEYKIVDILHAVPCKEDPCKTYNPKGDALYVLETNINKFDESNIGQEVKLNIYK